MARAASDEDHSNGISMLWAGYESKIMFFCKNGDFIEGKSGTWPAYSMGYYWQTNSDSSQWSLKLEAVFYGLDSIGFYEADAFIMPDQEGIHLPKLMVLAL